MSGNRTWVPYTTTPLKPKAGSRVMYVDEDLGNDSSGEVYAREYITDIFNPIGDVLPFKTFRAAFSHTRTGSRDCVLIKTNCWG
jgi:hypothetical protein